MNHRHHVPRRTTLMRDLAIGRSLAQRASLATIASEQHISRQRANQIVHRLLANIYHHAGRPMPATAFVRKAVHEHPAMFQRVLEHYEQEACRDVS